MEVYIVRGYYYNDTYFDKVYINEKNAKKRTKYLNNLPDNYDWGKWDEVAAKYNVPKDYLDLQGFDIIQKDIADYEEGD